MKTKSKLVLGLSILSAAAMASATTATFAWFTAGNANNTVSQGTTSALQTQAGASGLGNFEIVPVVTPHTGFNIILTNDVGDTYMTLGETDTKVTATGAKVDYVEIGYKVKYHAADGETPTYQTVQEAWNAVAPTKIEISVSDLSVKATLYTAEDEASNAEHKAGTKKTAGLWAEAGLKFFTSAPEGTSYAGVSITEQAISLGTVTFTSENFTGYVDAVIGTPTKIFVGAKGVNGKEQGTSDAYTMGVDIVQINDVAAVPYSA